MNGKQHIAIGTVLGVGVATYLTYKNVQIGDFDSVNSILSNGKILGSYVKDTIAPVIIGSVVGALIQDVDTKKSKAARALAKLFIASLVLFAIMVFTKNDIVKGFLESGRTRILSNYWTPVFIINCILGYFSTHRGYTHRWLGFTVFIVSAYFVFNSAVFFGFFVGIISHVLADHTTKDGKNYKFFKLQLPMTNSKGKFGIY